MPAGTVTLICVSLQLLTGAFFAPNLTLLAPSRSAPNPWPDSVTVERTRPLAGFSLSRAGLGGTYGSP